MLVFFVLFKFFFLYFFLLQQLISKTPNQMWDNIKEQEKRT
jgi:hypothetical protein